MVKYIKSLKKHEYDYYSESYRVIFGIFQTVVHNKQHFVTAYSYLPVINRIVDALKIKTSILKVSKSNFDLEKDSLSLVAKFFDDVCKFTIKSKVTVVYFHQLNKYNGVFLLNCLLTKPELEVDVIFRENIIYEISVNTKDGKEILIRDSFIIFPVSFYTMAEYSDQYGKSKLFNPEGRTFSDTPNYLLNDYLFSEKRATVTQKSIEKVLLFADSFHRYQRIIYSKFEIDIVSCKSLSSLAFKFFRRKYYLDGTIQQSSGFMDSFIRKSYRGGIVDVYKPKIKNGYYYDVNSLYPYIMSNNHMPVGEGKFGNAQKESTFDINSFFGFISVKVKSPKFLYIPFLTINHSENGLVSPLGEWTDIYFSEEIKYAIQLGYSFEYFEYYQFDKAVVFDKYVDYLYNIRLSEKDNKFLSPTIKLLLNSLYGRFGMRNSNYRSVLVKNVNKEEYLSPLSLIYNVETMKEFQRETTDTFFVKFDQTPDPDHINELYRYSKIDNDLYHNLLDKSFNTGGFFNIAVHIASAITAYSRIYMHTIKMKYINNIYYSDTDSLITDVQLDDNLVSENKLGLFKLEHKITEGIFISPKLYYLKTSTDEIIKCKGVESGSLTYCDFLKLYENEHIKVNVFKNFLRNLKNYKATISESEIEIKGLFVKREKIFINNIWVDTKPKELK